MPTLFYSGRDAAKREPRGGQTKINDLYTVTGGFPTFQTIKIHKATQRALESEIQARFSQPIEFPQEEATSRQRSQFRPQGRKSTGNQIRIYEVNHSGILGQKFSRKSGFSRSVRPGDDNANWRLARLLAHFGGEFYWGYAKYARRETPSLNVATFAQAQTFTS
jgi:hypothetical protein